MASVASLLDRMTGASSPYGPLLLSLDQLFTGLARSILPPGITIEPVAHTESSCLVVRSNQVAPFFLTESEGWADYGEIIEAFDARTRQRRRTLTGAGSKTSPLPEELVCSGPRLLIRDSDNPLACVVVTGRIYPRRAWVGALHPMFGGELPYVLAGILNSTLGLVLYRRVSGQVAGSSHDVRKSALVRMRIPWLTYDTVAFRRAALLSYRLHCLCAAAREVSLPASVLDEDIPNHRAHLLSELVRLYGFEDAEAREIVEKVLPEGAADVLGAQRKLFYRPKEPLEPIRLHTSETIERYETLKARARRHELDSAGAGELARLQALLTWEHRANSPVPVLPLPREPKGAFSSEAAIRAANRYLSSTRGQATVARSAKRISSSLWEVELRTASPLTSGARWAATSPSVSGTLWVNVLTGAVSDDPRRAQDAAASGPG
jgi:hypothetical protein